MGQQIRATTVVAVRKGGQTAVGADGQVTMGETVVKTTALKVRELRGGSILAGFAGAVADAFTLFEKLEEKLERYPGNLTRALSKFSQLDAPGVVREALMIAGEICIYSNQEINVLELKDGKP